MLTQSPPSPPHHWAIHNAPISLDPQSAETTAASDSHRTHPPTLTQSQHARTPALPAPLSPARFYQTPPPTPSDLRTPSPPPVSAIAHQKTPAQLRSIRIQTAPNPPSPAPGSPHRDISRDRTRKAPAEKLAYTIPCPSFYPKFMTTHPYITLLQWGRMQHSPHHVPPHANRDRANRYDARSCWNWHEENDTDFFKKV